jgi:uncharacterized protein YbbC (DUF1343 family)
MILSTSNTERLIFPSLTNPTITVLGMLLLLVASCKTPQTAMGTSIPAHTMVKSKSKSNAFLTGADNMESYLNLLRGKKVGVLTNPSGLVSLITIIPLPIR